MNISYWACALASTYQGIVEFSWLQTNSTSLLVLSGNWDNLIDNFLLRIGMSFISLMKVDIIIYLFTSLDDMTSLKISRRVDIRQHYFSNPNFLFAEFQNVFLFQRVFLF